MLSVECDSFAFCELRGQGWGRQNIGKAMALHDISADTQSILEPLNVIVRVVLTFRGNHQEPTLKELRHRADVADTDDFHKLLEYPVLLYSDMGRYLSVDDSEVAHNCARATLKKVVSVVPEAAAS